jgi:hypothetical protein
VGLNRRDYPETQAEVGLQGSHHFQGVLSDCPWLARVPSIVSSIHPCHCDLVKMLALFTLLLGPRWGRLLRTCQKSLPNPPPPPPESGQP